MFALADVAQLVEHHLAKVRVAGSNLVIRSKSTGPRVQLWGQRLFALRCRQPAERLGSASLADKGAGPKIVAMALAEARNRGYRLAKN